jgi:hypothetical protein
MLVYQRVMIYIDDCILLNTITIYYLYLHTYHYQSLSSMIVMLIKLIAYQRCVLVVKKPFA